MSAASNPRPKTNVCDRSRHGQSSANPPDETARQNGSYPLGNSFYFALSTFGALSILILLLLCSCGKKPAPLVNTSQSVPAPPQPKPDVSSAIVDDFLAHPVAITAPHWQKVPKPEEVIPGFLRQLADGPEDIDRGMAVGMLAEYAIGLSGEKQAHRVAREIIEKLVLPNLTYTKLLYATDARSWQYAILNCVTVYSVLATPRLKRNASTFSRKRPLWLKTERWALICSPTGTPHRRTILPPSPPSSPSRQPASGPTAVVVLRLRGKKCSPRKQSHLLLSHLHHESLENQQPTLQPVQTDSSNSSIGRDAY